MPRILKLAMLPILLTATACATPDLNVSLGLGPIICPQSLQTEVHSPGPLDPNFVSRLGESDQDYILSYQSGWETAIDESEAKAADALETCTDYNERLQRLRNESGSESPSPLSSPRSGGTLGRE